MEDIETQSSQRKHFPTQARPDFIPPEGVVIKYVVLSPHHVPGMEGADSHQNIILWSESTDYIPNPEHVDILAENFDVENNVAYDIPIIDGGLALRVGNVVKLFGDSGGLKRDDGRYLRDLSDKERSTIQKATVADLTRVYEKSHTPLQFQLPHF